MLSHNYVAWNSRHLPYVSSVWSWMKDQSLFISDTVEVNITSADTFTEQNLFFLGLNHYWLKYGIHSLSVLLKVSILSPRLSQLVLPLPGINTQQKICDKHSDYLGSKCVHYSWSWLIRCKITWLLDFHCQHITQMGENGLFMSSNWSVRGP
jgi:hypothetical protein